MVSDDGALDAQRRYARFLLLTTRLGAVLLVASFIDTRRVGWRPTCRSNSCLHSGRCPPRISCARRSHIRPGWPGWAALILHGDMLALGAIAILITSSILCLAAAMPLFWKRGEKLLVVLCALQIAVLALAASGILA